MREISPAVGLLAVLSLLGCATERAVQTPAAAPAFGGLPAIGARGVRVSLLWSAAVDLDLYVTDPALESVYFANPRSESGGRLERDVSCSVVGAGAAPWIESAAWGDAPPGRYRVGVDFIDACSSETDEAEFRVVAEVGGKREERIGRVARQRFEPITLEFDVPEKSGETRRKAP